MAAKKSAANTELIETETKRKRLVDEYRNEEKVSCSLSPLYAPYFGKVLQISLNGVTIAFPVDGSSHKIPKSFAAELATRRMAVDAIIKKNKSRSDIAKNNESYPGELPLY